MNARQAKREACNVVALLIDSYMGVGQPSADCDDPKVEGWKPEDGVKLEAAFEALQEEMERRAKGRLLRNGGRRG